MKRFSRGGLCIVLVCIGILLVDSMVLAQQQESIGSVTALQGKATVMHKESTQSEPLATHSPLYPEDTIQTEAASKIKLSFADGTVLMLGEESTVKITRFVYSPQRNTHTTLFTIVIGVFRAIAQKILPQSQFEVTTTTAVAALRGTDWLGEVTPDSTAMVVLLGTVAVSNARSDIPGEVILTEGMGTTVEAGQPPTAPRRWGAARVNALRQAASLP